MLFKPKSEEEIIKNLNCLSIHKINSLLINFDECSADSYFYKIIVSNYNIDIDIKNQYGVTPLLRASYYGYYNVVKYLLENGANFNYRHSGGSCLSYAKQFNFVDIVKLLIKYGATE